MPVTGGEPAGRPVVEHLTFAVDDGDLDAWLDVDERTWTEFLAGQDGFVGKQVWVERRPGDDAPGTVHVVITWRDESAWQAIPAADLAAVDEAMGPWRRPAVLRTFDVLRAR